MAVSKGKLDDLMGTTYTSADYQSLAILSVTDDSSSNLSTVTALTTGAPAPGSVSGETFKVVSFNDANDTVTLLEGTPYGTTVGTTTLNVIAFSSSGLLLSQLSPDYFASGASGNTSGLNNFAGVLSTSPIPTETQITFSINTLDNAVPSRGDDFNGDGRSDLLLQNNNGAIVVETIGSSGLTVSAAVSLGNPGNTWNVVGTGDFNGDGNTDILLQNVNGQLVDYLMNGTSVASASNLLNPGDTWHVRGIADFNGDGKSDIVLQNQTDGNMAIWFTNGTSITSAVDLGSPGASWTIEGVGDFNGDGHPDILVQNSNGQLLDYLMNGSTITVAHYLGYPGPGWSVAGVGDYNGDGTADILLHNDNGADVVWNTNGATVTGSTVVGNPGAQFSTVSAGVDLNGDGSSDMIVQSNSSGEIAGYTIDNTATITAGSVLDTPGPTWHLATSNPILFVDGTGAALNLTATPGVDQFVLTSVATGLHTISGFDPAQDTVALSAAAFPSYANIQANEQPYMGGTYINLSSNDTSGLFIQGVTPSQLSAASFVMK